jgi:hypothetical protein
MGKSTLANHKMPTACCSFITSDSWAYPGYQNGIPGVSCTEYGKVTGISWSGLSLKGHIPSGIGYLKNLEWL